MNITLNTVTDAMMLVAVFAFIKTTIDYVLYIKNAY
jgi:hypothetical protein